MAGSGGRGPTSEGRRHDEPAAIVIDAVFDPAYVDPSLDSRATTFENPSGARGAGGSAHGGRKGAPNRSIEPGERVCSPTSRVPA